MHPLPSSNPSYHISTLSSQTSSPIALTDVRWVRGTPHDPNSFNSMQFVGKFGKIVCWRLRPECWRPHLREILDPPLNCCTTLPVPHRPLHAPIYKICGTGLFVLLKWTNYSVKIRRKRAILEILMFSCYGQRVVFWIVHDMDK